MVFAHLNNKHPPLKVRSVVQANAIRHNLLNGRKGQDVLTADQKIAFREVFDLFDSNGGGTIDAEELDEALKSADIHLSTEEIADVLTSMDKDGNGEIDFEEFLQLMTNTERFLESVMFVDDQERKQREVLLFDALTQFMKKSALHSINEIVGYYHSKYKKVQAPHVIRHYADGARLIGLSEQQIRRHLDRLRESSVDNKSPYAQPPYALFVNSKAAIKKKKITPDKLAPIPENDAPPQLIQNSKISDNLNMLVPSCGGRGKIRLKFVINEKQERKSNNKSDNLRETQQTSMNSSVRHEAKGRKRYNGWVSQRITTTQIHLPVLTAELIKRQVTQENKICEDFRKSKILTFDDMSAIRHRVGNLAKAYYERIQTEKCVKASRHWESLAVEEMPSLSMRHAYHRVFKAYVNYHSMPVSSLCSRSLA
ncbi:uncharacterized protein LOC130642305 [Hydractinia symbiolongicarpus]|uniref:uncharacterized protein LOC130642305 n=1 Tax=Hydractinia symbiolongicarpus TaxID=13093 RepID=UPI00254FCF8A|nr:uncharacterized protein LOC130642305 [Hydractinia symbiolongicarpus]